MRFVDFLSSAWILPASSSICSEFECGLPSPTRVSPTARHIDHYYVGPFAVRLHEGGNLELDVRRLALGTHVNIGQRHEPDSSGGGGTAAQRGAPRGLAPSRSSALADALPAAWSSLWIPSYLLLYSEIFCDFRGREGSKRLGYYRVRSRARLVGRAGKGDRTHRRNGHHAHVYADACANKSQPCIVW